MVVVVVVVVVSSVVVVDSAVVVVQGSARSPSPIKALYRGNMLEVVST